MTEQSDESLRVGFAGLGAMGMPMARNLSQAGLLTAVYNRTIDKAQAFADQHQVVVAESVAELASQCNVILLCVSRGDMVLDLVDDMLPHLQAEAVVIDMSTVSAATAQQAATRLASVQADFLDAPVSGGTEGAQKGSLSIMVGGYEQVLERVQPVLECVGERITHMGPSGSGQATKAVNQVMAAGINQAVSEALAFAEALELNLDKVIDVVGAGAAGNWFLSHRGKTMVRGEYPPGFKLALHYKDLTICQGMIADLNTDTDREIIRLPLVEMTREHYQRLLDAGHGDEDISVLFKLKQELFNQS